MSTCYVDRHHRLRHFAHFRRRPVFYGAVRSWLLLVLALPSSAAIADQTTGPNGTPLKACEKDEKAGGDQVKVEYKDIRDKDGRIGEELKAETRRDFRAPYPGEYVPQDAIDMVARCVQAKYRADGYFLAVARAGAVTDAKTENAKKVTIYVTKGHIRCAKEDPGSVAKIDQIRCTKKDQKSHERSVTAAVQAYLDRLANLPRSPLTSNLERDILLAQSVPGVKSLRTYLRSAPDEPGEIDIYYKVATSDYNFHIRDDNRGSPEAGPNQIVAGFDRNSLFKAGDSLQFSTFDTPFNDNEVFGRLAYNQRLSGWNGLGWGVYFGYGTALPGDVLAIAGYSSHSLLAGAVVDFPVYRGRVMSWMLNAGLDIVQEQIFTSASSGISRIASDSNLRIVHVGTKGNISDETADNSGNLQISQGIPELFAGTRNGIRDRYPARPAESNNFFKIMIDGSRDQTLYREASYNDQESNYTINLFVKGAAQWSPVLLPPTEKYYLGGDDFVRGFYNGEVSGDRSAGGTVEIRADHNLGINYFKSVLTPIQAFLKSDPADFAFRNYLFYDIGQVWDRGQGEGFQRRHLESLGIGMLFRISNAVQLNVEGVERFTRRPNGSATVNLESEQAGYFSLNVNY